MTEGMKAYQIYMALKLHFTTQDYDYFKYSGKTKSISPEKLKLRKDYHHFCRLERRYSSNLEDFFVCQFVLNDKKAIWIGDMVDVNSQTLFNKWKKNIESFRYEMKIELEKVSDKDIHTLFRVQNGNHPEFLRALLSKKIGIMTFLACDDVINFMPSWNKNIKDEHIWPEISARIEKFRPFYRRMNIEKKTTREIIKQIFELDNSKADE
jgi:hypothetical protein